MILQALQQYYDRKAVDVDSVLAPFGFEWKELPFIVELNIRGVLIQIEDTREPDGKKKTARRFLVPQSVKRSSGVAANLLWDNAEYVFGVDIRGKPDRVRQQHKAFVEKLNSLPETVRDDPGVRSVLEFLSKLALDDFEHDPQWDHIKSTNPNIGFRLQGDTELICQRPVVQKVVQDASESIDSGGICLVTGSKDQIERVHPAIKGVWGAQTSGGNLVSFNLDAFHSYGKDQNYNAPVGRRSVFQYTTALNHLLRKGSAQRIQVGDTSTVFWADKKSDLEVQIVDIFGMPRKDNPDSNIRAIESLYKSIDAGLLNSPEGHTRFYVLGLAPNAARIAVRFWEVATVAELAARFRQHFEDLAIVHRDSEPPHLPLFRLLVSTATLGKSENIPPNLAGEFMHSILAGLPYPKTLLMAAVRRIRAEREITYPRAAIIKACLNRAARHANREIEEELKMYLDETNTNVGYRLGRLFAVLEKAQEEASPGINATIRDRYYGSAASTPVSVFSTLLKLKNHHLRKLENKGRVVNLEKMLGGIMDGINDFPASLSLADQGRFAIGYYHQRNAFFKKHNNDSPEGD